MTLGKFGLSLAAVAVLAFILGFFGFLEVLVLIVAFALILEKDPWLTRQTLQALFLRLAYSVALTVVGWVFTAFNALFGLFDAFKVMSVFGQIQSVINFLLYIGLFIFSLIAVLKLARGEDAALPLVGSLADATMGLIKKKTVPSPAPAPAPVSYATAPTPVPPAASAAPTPVTYAAAPTPVAPAAPAVSAPAPAPAASAVWTCSCGRENNGNFCMSCGNPRPKG